MNEPDAPEVINSTAALLRVLATHCASDWDYTRQHNITRIRYADDGKGHALLDRRIRRGVLSLFHRRTGLSAMFVAGTMWAQFHYRVAYFRALTRRDNHLPDGVLGGGRVITYWEEDGEYLQMVQPSVGALLAEFLTSEPENPHAQKITAELDRIQSDYARRCASGSVDFRA